MRLVSAVGKMHRKWDEMFLEGKVLEELSENMCLFKFIYKRLSETLKKRDFVVVRSHACVTSNPTTLTTNKNAVTSINNKNGLISAQAMSQSVQQRKTYVIIDTSVPHPSVPPPYKSYIRGEVVMTGWIIKETGFSSCVATRVVLMDFKGNIPSHAANLLNAKLSASAVVNLKNQVLLFFKYLTSLSLCANT
jgi:hypothetical protein